MAEGSSKSCPFGGRLAPDDPEIVEVSAEVAAGWSCSRRQKRKRTQVVPNEIIELDADDDSNGVTIIGEKTSDHKNKQAAGYPMDWPKNAKSGLAEDVAGPSAIPAQNVYPWNGLGAYHGGTMLPVYFDNSFEAFEEDDYAYDEEEYDNYSYNTSPVESDTSFNLNANYYMGFPPGVGAVLPWGHMTPAEMPHQNKQIKIVDSEIDEKYKAFKQFDTVGDHSDHFYSMPGKRKVQAVKKPSKVWVKRIQHEWKVLEKDLPDTIFVRVYEDRMDLLRAVIVGPAGTPYHDGLFFFDVYFPSQYPSKPPLVNYRAGGLRLNPNLYACGKVCLSLLNTWSGSGCEKWNPSNSTMLQVLVSIQALVLNAKPYFNEPGYAAHANTPHGEKMSLAYNEETFLLSCRTMLYSLRNPPKHFEDFIGGHFRKYGCNILIGCKAYMGGAQVGCLVGDGVQDVDEGDKSCSENFKGSLKKLFGDLMMEFTPIGVDCCEFQARVVSPAAATATADTTLML